MESRHNTEATISLDFHLEVKVEDMAMEGFAVFEKLARKKFEEDLVKIKKAWLEGRKE